MNRGSEAARLGIESEFVDARGQRRTVAAEVIEQLVLALQAGVHCQHEQLASADVVAREAPG